MSIILSNRKAYYNFEILERFSTGIKLMGYEVKSLKTAKGGSLIGSFLITYNGKLWIKNLRIPHYQPANMPASYNPLRTRELLVTKRELHTIANNLTTKGLTAIPLAVHNNRHRIVVECAIVRGKQKYDKRQTLRKREDEIKMRRVVMR